MKEEDIKLHLPKFLSPETFEQLKKHITDFIAGKEGQNFYSHHRLSDQTIYQGDLIDKLPIYDWSNKKWTKAKAIILSNTCDISPENGRLSKHNLTYCPVVNIESYESVLLEEYVQKETSIKQFISSIEKQHVTNTFFLPEPINEKNYFIRFDMVHSIPLFEINQKELLENRIAVLSQFAHYLFLLKLSIHFCRFQDKVDRDYISKN